MLADKIFFDNGSELHFTEVINTNQKNKQKYSYHYMDKDKNLIVRYDNIQHYRHIKTFPHHKHTQNGVEESQEPDLKQVLQEIEKNIINK